MRRLQGVGFVVLAIAMLVFLVIGWDFLGRYYIVLTILPKVPLMGARLFVALGAIVLVFRSKGLLFPKRPEAPSQTAFPGIERDLQA